jgi:hypothetical protein
MTFRIKALKNVEAIEELVLLDNIFNTTQEALDFVKTNLSLNNVNENTNIVVITINDVHYHYFEIIEQ